MMVNNQINNTVECTIAEFNKEMSRPKKLNTQLDELEKKYISDKGMVQEINTPICNSNKIGSWYFTNGFTLSKTSFNSPVKMPEETKTYLYVENGEIRIATYKNRMRQFDTKLISAIEDVQVLNDRVVMVKFVDGTTEKAVLDDSDTFSIEQGISICISKKILSVLTKGNGGSVYNKLVEYGLKAYEEVKKRKYESAKENAEKNAKAKRNAERAKRKRSRKAAKKREYDIEIQKEAYLRAMRELQCVN